MDSTLKTNNEVLELFLLLGFIWKITFRLRISYLNLVLVVFKKERRISE